MSYWIAHTLREERERAGVDPQVLASILGVNEVTIKRLEQGENYGRDIDRTVTVYAYALGLEDARELWARALESWHTKGAAPSFSDGQTTHALEFARAIREVAQRQRKSRDDSSSTRSAIQKRRAAG
jgi:transcriptional regulator with XRE-family HTH domain